MTHKLYIAAVEPALDGGWGVFFPDLPGCTSGGDTLEEATANAREALALHVKGLIEDGESLPEPRGAADIAADDPDAGAPGVILIALAAPADAVEPPPERINVSIHPRLLGRIDTHARAAGMTRSAFLALAARQALEQAQNAKSPPPPERQGAV